MSEGSLSDRRAVALLTEWFIPVQLPELCTAELIQPEDRPLVDALDRKLQGKGGLYGGQRDLFLSPAGEVLTFRCALTGRDHGSAESPRDSQYRRIGREHPDGPVVRFLDAAADALRTVHGKLPAEWAALRAGTSPLLAGVEAAPIPWPMPAPGTSALRLWVRNSQLMYDSLVGVELMPLTPAELRALLPATLSPGAEQTWPAALFTRLGQRLAPRGQVLSRLAASSVSGHLKTRLASVAGGLVHGTFDGELGLAPTDAAEVSRRPTAACLFRSHARLFGEFTWDTAAERFVRLRLASADEQLTWRPRYGGEASGHQHLIAVELVLGPGAPATAASAPSTSRPTLETK